MKNTLTILIVLFVTTLTAQDKYTETMLKSIDGAYKNKTVAEHQATVNAFERIAAAEKTKWEPYYYAAFSNIMAANLETENAKKDAFLDLATKAIDQAKAIKANDSEIIALEGFVYMMRVTVDPATRGQEYSGKAFRAFSTAVTLNPENPRALALLAQMQFGTAKFFNSSTAEACGTADKSIHKFETYQAENVLSPQWGKQMAEDLKVYCKL